MNSDILVSKIVGTPSESSWSQASSTGKLYIALSVTSENEKSGIISLGKETLEQIQREFFALDQKSLTNIKKAVENVFSVLDKKIQYSAVVATIVDDILYIVTASNGMVLIERKQNLAEVARGEEGQIIGFSGRIKNNDIIILETKGFNNKISNKLLAEYTGTQNGAQIAEDIAPFILEDSMGEEAAIIIHFKNHDASTSPVANEEKEMHVPQNNDREEERLNYEEKSESIYETPYEKETTGTIENLKNRFSTISPKKRVIIAALFIIVIILFGSLFAERFSTNKSVAVEEFNAIYSEASDKYESANGLSSLNRGRALEEADSAIAQIESNLSKFSEGSEEYAKLNELLSKLKSLRDQLGGGSEVAGSVIFEAGTSEVLDSISAISESSGNLIVAGDTGYAVINEDGEIDAEEETDLNIDRMISDDTYLYVLSDNVNRLTISNGNNSEIIEGSSDAVDISYFGSSVYLLTGGGEVKKYSGSAFSESDYFKSAPNLSGKAISFAIDSSIYILTDDSSIQKFAKGEKDADFEYDGSVKISQNSRLYSREEFENIYVLDIDNASIVQINTDGKVQKQFNSLDLQNAKSFTINADESKAYVVIDDKVYSYDL